MRYLTFIVMLCFAVTASAQSVEQFRQGLLSTAESGGNVVVIEGEGVSDAILAVEGQRRSKEVSGFRVVIFSDNGQYAGDNADAVLQEFKTLYPRINAYLVYESPYFKVSVGDCLSMEQGYDADISEPCEDRRLFWNQRRGAAWRDAGYSPKHCPLLRDIG